MFLVATLGLFTLALVIVRMFVGGRFGRTVQGWTFSVVLFAGWLGLWTCYSRLEWLGLRLHAHQALPRFKTAAEPLLESWPVADGVLPEAGRFEVQPEKWANTLFLLDSPFHPVRTTFSTTIVKTESGGLRFDVRDNPSATLEYHPSGHTPTSHVIEHWPIPAKRKLLKCTKLDESWYLAKYGMGH